MTNPTPRPDQFAFLRACRDAVGVDRIDEMNPMIEAIAYTLGQIDSTEKSLTSAALRLSERMARLATDVETGRSVNSLGEVQSYGTEVDRLCGLRHAQYEHLTMLRYLARRSDAALGEVIDALLG